MAPLSWPVENEEKAEKLQEMIFEDFGDEYEPWVLQKWNVMIEHKET